jgi:hypothetical protein
LPTYYNREGFDLPYGSISLGEQIDLINEMKSPDSNDSTEILRHNRHKTAVIFDLRALEKESR